MADHLAPEIDERTLLVSNQETELFVLSADSVPALIERMEEVRRLSDGISEGEMVDLAAKLADEQEPSHGVRAALIAEKPSELNDLLVQLGRMLAERPPRHGEILSDPQHSIWIGNHVDRARVGFLFPGQGSQQLNMARTLIERYPWARRLVEQAAEWLRPFGLEGIKELMYRPVDRAVDEEQAAWTDELKRTEVAQPAICLASLLWRKYLEKLGVEPVAVGGHSLGELSAFHAAGAFDAEKLLRLAAVRGRAMAARGGQSGAMASLACPPEVADQLVNGSRGDVVIANVNSFIQTVISGDRAAVHRQPLREAVPSRRRPAAHASGRWRDAGGDARRTGRRLAATTLGLPQPARPVLGGGGPGRPRHKFGPCRKCFLTAAKDRPDPPRACRRSRRFGSGQHGGPLADSRRVGSVDLRNAPGGDRADQRIPARDHVARHAPN